MNDNVASSQPQKLDLENTLGGILSSLFTKSKRLWQSSLIMQAVILLIGAVSVIIHNSSGGIAFVIALISILGYIIKWRSDYLRDSAEALLRQVELKNSFGLDFDVQHLSFVLKDQLQIDQSNQLLLGDSAKKRQQEQSTFWASTSPVGAKRAIENTKESAWWSQHLAWYMTKRSAILAILLVGVCLYGLIVVLLITFSNKSQPTIAQIATSVVALAFTGDFIRYPFEYYKFYIDAKKTYEEGTNLLSKSNISVADAFRFVNDYQIMRVKTPLLPDWAWRNNKNKLNALWKTLTDSSTNT